jgi:predicted Zn-dependent peptidase
MKTIYSLLTGLFAAASFLNAQTLDRSIRPSSGPAKEVQIKDAQVFTLSNGLKVFLVEDKTTPIVYYSLMLDADPALQGDKVGLHDVFGDVYGKATPSRTKEQLSKEADLIAAHLSAGGDGVHISFLKKYETQALDLFADVLLHPRFNPEDFDLAVEKINTYLASLGDDGGGLTQRIANTLAYGKNFPDGELLTRQTIENVQIADLETYYNTYFAPNVAKLVIVGDVSRKEAQAAAKKYLGGWKKKTVPAAKYTIPSAPDHTQVAYIVKPGAVQSSVSVTYPIPFRIDQPDYDAARIMNQILGGTSGYLFNNLREQHSYTYGVYSALTGNEHIGSFTVTGGRGAAAIKAAATDSAIYEILAELKRITIEPVTEQALKSAKTYLAGSFSRSLESPTTLAEFAIKIDKYKLPKDYYKNYLKRLDAVTLADVQAAAQKYIRPENAWIVVTGDKAHAEKLLPFAGDHAIHYYDYDANPIAAPVSESANISANAILANYAAALGGKEAIEKIANYTQKADFNAMGQSLSLTRIEKGTDRLLFSIEMSGMVVQKIAFDGTVLRTSGMGGSQEITEGPIWENTRDGIGIAPELQRVERGYTLTVGDIEEINGAKTHVLTSTKGDTKTVDYFDIKSGLKIKTVTLLSQPEGEQQSVIEYSDYRAVSGVLFPFTVKQTVGGMVTTLTVQSIEVNQDLDETLFQ